jgi:hypothetical protein
VLAELLLVVISSLKKIDAVNGDFINHPMLLSNSPAPGAGEFMLERLGFADTIKGVGKHGVYEFQSANRSFALVFNEPY